MLQKVLLAAAASLFATAAAANLPEFRGRCALQASVERGEVRITWRFDSPVPDLPIGVVVSRDAPDAKRRAFSLVRESVAHRGHLVYPLGAEPVWLGLAVVTDSPTGNPFCEVRAAR